MNLQQLFLTFAIILIWVFIIWRLIKFFRYISIDSGIKEYRIVRGYTLPKLHGEVFRLRYNLPDINKYAKQFSAILRSRVLSNSNLSDASDSPERPS